MKISRSIAVVVVAILALAGCSRDDFSLLKISDKIGLRGSDAKKKDAPAVQLAPSPAPIYAAGDTFVYSNDGILVQEQVVSATPDRVTWTNDQGMIWTTSSDVITPQLSWSSHKELGRGRQTVIGNPQALFPLREGNTVAFGVRGNSEIVPTGWRDEHRCAVLGQMDVDVSAGRFTTFHISCQRKDHVEELFYSPVAQNYVLRVRDFGASESRKELVSIALSDDRTKNLPVAVARQKPAKAHDEMSKNRSTTKQMMANGNPRVGALVSRLEMIVNRLERMSGGGHDKGMAKKLHAKADKMVDRKSAGGKYGAHLASYRTVAGAKRGWRSLSRKFSKELGGLDFGTTEFDAGDGKGTYVRLVAVSFKSKASATKFCRTLKTKRQFCKATRAKP